MRLRRAVLCLAVAATSVVTAAAPATAQGPAQQGWWTAANPGSAQGLPSPPAPPDVPANGLLIEGGPSSSKGTNDAGPTAYAAVVYELPSSSTVGKLTLAVAQGSATTPTAILQLCPLTTAAFFPSQGGPIAEGPQFYCSKQVSSAVSADGTIYAFDVAALVVDDVLAVAVLPTSATDRVVLNAPNAGSLAVQQSSIISPVTDEPSPPVDPSSADDVATVESPVATGTAIVPQQAAADPVLGPTPQVVSHDRAWAPQTTDAELSPAAQSTSGPSPITVVVLVVAACLGWALWTAAGRAAVRRSIPARGGPSMTQPHGSAR